MIAPRHLLLPLLAAAMPGLAEDRPLPRSLGYYDGVARSLLALGYTEPELSDPGLREVIARDPGGREVILTIHPRNGTIMHQAFHDRRVIQVGRRGRPKSEVAIAR